MPLKMQITGGLLSSRKRLLSLAALTAAIVLGIGVLSYLRFDPEYFQRIVISRMEKRFNLRVSLSRAEVVLWPSLGLELENLEARRKEPEESEPFLTVKAASLYVRTLPLFWGRYEVSRILLEAPDLRVTRGPEGRFDVEDLLEPTGTKDGKKTEGVDGRLFVTKTEVRRGRLTITQRNAAGKLRRTRVEPLDLEIKDLAYGGEPEFKLTAVMGEPSPGAHLHLEGGAGRLERGKPFGELPLDLKLEADRFDLGPIRGFLPEKWRGRVRTGALTCDLSIHGRVKKDLSVKGDFRIENADFGDHYALQGVIIGKIDWRGAEGKSGGKADLRLAPGVFTKGSMQIDGQTDIRADVTSGVEGFGAKLRIDATRAAYLQGSVFEKPPGTRLELEGVLSRGASGLRVREAEGKLGDLPFTGSADIGRSVAPGRSTPYDLHFFPEKVELATLQDYVEALGAFALDGEAEISRLDIIRRPEESREYQVTIDMKLGGVSATIPLSDGRAHTVRDLTAGVAIVPGRLISEEAQGEINGAPVHFKADVTEFMAMIAPARGRPRADVRLEIWNDEIDLDRLLQAAAGALRSGAVPAPRGAAFAAPPDTPEPGGENQPAPSQAVPESLTVVPGPEITGGNVDFLERFFVKESILRADSAIYARQALTGLVSRFNYHNPVLRLDETRFKAHEGEWSVDGTVALNTTNTFDLGVKVAHARVESISRAFSETEQEPAIFGMLDGEGELHGQGKDLEAWEKTLRGKGRITVRDGRLPGFNIFETVIRAILGVFAKVIPVGKLSAVSGENTFESFEQDFRIEEGRIWSDPIELTTIDYVMKGKGSAGLDRTLDYRTTVRLTAEGTQKMIALASLPILSGAFQGIAPVPVRIKGTTSKPVILPNASVISVGSVQALLQGVGEKAIGGARDAVQGMGRILGVGKNGKRPEKDVEAGVEGEGAPPEGATVIGTAPGGEPAEEPVEEPAEEPTAEEKDPDLLDQGLKQLEGLFGR
ncbi:MAG: AsmA-like C-terminal region-containing protein [Deltaproteobacteria bacterium]|nr:AsmA-like C-terminal region-containing protein [Deltaproteobacteria bacterium]